MMERGGMAISGWQTHRVKVSAKTTWLFVSVRLSSGCVGWGEGTLDGSMDAVEQRVAMLAGELMERPAGSGLLDPGSGMVEAAAISALRQALADAKAREQAISLAGFIGAEQRHAVELYANVNRRTVDRTPAGFAEGALAAAAEGFDAIKIAPFDEIRPDLAGRDGWAALDAGLSRIAAVRDALGPDRLLMVDCHWRFEAGLAFELVEACKGMSLHWIECPLPEIPENDPILTKLRAAAHRHGVLLAGGENVIGADGADRFIDAGCYDVIMPDVKYVGGPQTMMRMAERLQRAGVRFSPHNPSGPIAHAASLEVCAAVPETGLLECQFDESPLFRDIVDDLQGLPRGATVHLYERRVGIGVTLRDAVKQAQPCAQNKKQMEETNGEPKMV